MENMATVLESLGEPNALSPLSTVVHDEEDFASLGHPHPGDSIVESHINSDGDDTLVAATGDDDGVGVGPGHLVTADVDDDDDNDDHMGLSVAGIESDTLHHDVEGLAAVVGETTDGGVHAESLEETDVQNSLSEHSLLSGQPHLGEDGGIGDNVMLTADADGNLAMRVSTDQVIRFLLQTSDGNVVTADAQVEAVKFSMPGLVEASDVAQTVQAYTLPDGTTFFQTQQKDNNVTECPPASIVKEEPQQAIKLEDGSMALLNPRETLSVPEGTLQAIQLEDGTTALITPHKDSLFDAQVSLDQLQAQTLLSVAATEKPEKSLVIGDKAYKCMYEDCGRLYTTLHHLRVHERSHTGDRPFTCEYSGCGKAFATGYGLKSHNRVHTGEKPYPCPQSGCDKAFKTSGDLQKHVRTHTGERPFKCPFEGCTRSFTTSNIRKVHIRTHTGERPYICDVEGCGRAFASATNYKNHIRIHTGEKPYVCSVRGCGKAFTEYSSLYKHHVVHTHTKPYTCCYCGKTYRQTSTLAMHKRSAHGEDLPTDGAGNVIDNAGIIPLHKDAVRKGSVKDKTEAPAKKKLKIEVKPKMETGSQVVIPASQGDTKQQVVLLTAPQVTPVVPSTATTTNNTAVITTTDNTASTTIVSLPSSSLLSSSSSSLSAPPVTDSQHQQQQQPQQPQQVASLMTLQAPNGTFSLADLQQSGLHALNLGEGQHQVLVVTDPAQLEILQQLTIQQLEPTTIVSQGGAEEGTGVPTQGEQSSSVDSGVETASFLLQ